MVGRIVTLEGASQSARGDTWLRLILVGGILLRIIVFVFLSPQNNDDHLEVIAFIIEHSALPTSDQLGQAYHPPLYYLLALPWALLGSSKGSSKVVQVFSLLLSSCNLYLLYRLIKTTRLLADEGAKRHALMLATVLPQFVAFGSFVSNDTLSYLLGTLTFLQAFATIERPTRPSLILLGLVLGAGLLTKGTFIGFVPVAAVLVVYVGLRQRSSLKQHVIALAVLCLVAGVVGSYKFIENTIHLGRPIVHNLDFWPWWRKTQSGTYQGLRSLVDLNVWTLVRHPYICEQTWHSLPLLMYGTFWYSHVPESSFTVIRDLGLDLVPQAIYLAGLLPTLLIALGLGVWLWRNRSLVAGLGLPQAQFVLRTQEKVSLLLFISNLALVVATGLRFDVWSCFQGRLVFPSIAAVVLLFGAGFEALCHWRAFLRRPLNVLLVAGYVALGSYFAVEVGYAAQLALQALP